MQSITSARSRTFQSSADWTISDETMIDLTEENTEVLHPSKVQTTDDQLKSYIHPDLLTPPILRKMLDAENSNVVGRQHLVAPMSIHPVTMCHVKHKQTQG